MIIEILPHGPLELLSPAETKALMDEGRALIVDVRNPDEYEMARLPGSLLRPLRELDPAEFADSDKKLVFVRAVGVRSRHAADLALAHGAEAVAHLEGGLQAWMSEGLPLE
jgi:rhodanese-related sulfurtransferase